MNSDKYNIAYIYRNIKVLHTQGPDFINSQTLLNRIDVVQPLDLVLVIGKKNIS